MNDPRTRSVHEMWSNTDDEATCSETVHIVTNCCNRPTWRVAESWVGAKCVPCVQYSVERHSSAHTSPRHSHSAWKPSNQISQVLLMDASSYFCHWTGDNSESHRDQLRVSVLYIIDLPTVCWVQIQCIHFKFGCTHYELAECHSQTCWSQASFVKIISWGQSGRGGGGEKKSPVETGIW